MGIVILAMTTQMHSQNIELNEIEVVANYNYVTATNYNTTALPVQNLQKAIKDYKAHDVVLDTYGDVAYSITFYNEDGKVLVDYNKEGTIIKTTETYKNIRLPLEVMQAIAKRFPNWVIVEDTYYVSYECDKGITKKIYKIKIMNNDKVLNLKTNPAGDFI